MSMRNPNHDRLQWSILHSSPHLSADGGEALVAEDELPGTVEGFSLPLWKKKPQKINHP